MRDPILGDILAMDEMIDRKAEQISKERGIKDPVEARMEVIAYARSGNGIIDLLARKRDEIIDARIRAKEEAAHNFLVSQGWDGVDMEKAKEIADKFICEEHPDGAITFREKTEEEIASEELLSCPFCGSNEVEIKHIVSVKGDVNDYFGSCKKCGTNMGCFKTEEEAIKAWNNRPSPWHTEEPAEEGLYVVLTKVTTIGIHSSEGAYILDWWDGYCFKNLKQMARHNPVFGNDVYSWVKWQKIEL